MTAALDDDGVFVRSLASRGYLGGLSPAAVRIIDALDGAGFDIILLETVGTGQSEIDVAEVADIRVVISAPGLGDDIQAMKSGLLEIADVLVVNKGDRPGAEQTMQQLIGALSIRATVAGNVPVLKTCAISGDGVAKLVETLDEIGRRVAGEGAMQRRRRRARYLIARAAADVVAARIKSGGKKQPRLPRRFRTLRHHDAGRSGEESSRRLRRLGLTWAPSKPQDGAHASLTRLATRGHRSLAHE